MATSVQDFRIESDLIGERQISNDKLYGVQTLRGVENFNISTSLTTRSSSTASRGRRRPRRLPTTASAC